jgi:3',5'-nucleoside bisphosphate phosphatase
VRYADLHLHTFHSDGVRSPSDVVALAATQRLDLISISDHDNVAALDEAREAAIRTGIEVITGVELSVDFEGIDVHILAYAFDPADEALLGRLASFRDTRSSRAETMVEKLLALDVPIDPALVRELCGEGAMGRPHVARALVESGAVGSVREAFERYLSPGCPAWVPKERLTVEEAVTLVRNAGGITSIAHPTLYPEHESLVPRILRFGVDAIEAMHPAIPDEWRDYYRRLALDRGLFFTAGSDDHGFEERATIGTVRIAESEIAPIIRRHSVRGPA